MVYRFLETLKTHEIVTRAWTPRLPHYTSRASVWLFMRHPDQLDEIERADLAAFRLAQAPLTTTYQLVQGFLQMLRHREGERLDTWLSQVQESGLPELQRFAQGVKQDKAAVQVRIVDEIRRHLKICFAAPYAQYQTRKSRIQKIGFATMSKTEGIIPPRYDQKQAHFQARNAGWIWISMSSDGVLIWSRSP